MTPKKNKDSYGFTLIELMVVVVTLALLIALIAVFYIKYIAKGNDARRKADLNRIKIAVEEYEKDHNCYPDPSEMGCGSSEIIAIHYYLSDVPCDPVTDEPYPYETEADNCAGWFRVYAKLQRTDDVQTTPNIGPGSIYNYYISSENAPAASGTSGSTSTPLPSATSGATDFYGCKSGVCVKLSAGSDGQPVCQPTFPLSNCNGVENCGTPSNPKNECIDIE